MTRCLCCSCLLLAIMACRDKAKLPFKIASAPPPTQTATDARQALCNRPLDRRGIPVRGVITAGDSAHFWVTEARSDGMPRRQFAFTSNVCLPVESSTGQRLSGSALVPGRAVAVWVGNLSVPTQPVQATAIGVQVYEPSTTPKR